MYEAVIFDLGGVVFPSPFEAFDRYDERHGLPVGTVRSVVRASSETGAWAALERGEISMTDFFDRLEAEAAVAGHTIDARIVMATIAEEGGARPEMTQAIARLREHGLKVGALTNNWAGEADESTPRGIAEMVMFDTIVESTKVGLRKPDPRIYELACERLGVTPPVCVFLDDLGINLKPAHTRLGMATIKVTHPKTAIAELAELLALDLA